MSREEKGRGKENTEVVITEQINRLFFLTVKQKKNQGADWQLLTHASGIGCGGISPNYNHVCRKLPSFLLPHQSEVFCFALLSRTKMLEVLPLLFPPSALTRSSDGLQI